MPSAAPARAPYCRGKRSWREVEGRDEWAVLPAGTTKTRGAYTLSWKIAGGSSVEYSYSRAMIPTVVAERSVCAHSFPAPDESLTVQRQQNYGSRYLVVVEVFKIEHRLETTLVAAPLRMQLSRSAEVSTDDRDGQSRNFKSHRVQTLAFRKIQKTARFPEASRPQLRRVGQNSSTVTSAVEGNTVDTGRSLLCSNGNSK